MSKREEIEAELRDFIINEFLPDEDPEDLTSDIELLSTGILDSVSTLKVVTHIEEVYNVTVEAHEANAENLNTLGAMAALVESKLG